MPSEKLSERMADLARDLRSDDDTEQTLQHVVEAAVELIEPCASAGISLASRGGHIETSAATDTVPRRGDALQQELGEGPCVDAAWANPVIRVPDLGREQRWPRWAPQAHRDFRMGSMLCVRLFTHADRIGALNMYAAEVDAFDEDHFEEARAIAAHAAVAVAAAERIENLEGAIVNRTAIGQATGLVMAQYELTDGQAFNLLRRLSSVQNRKLAEIARELVAQHNAEVDQS
jgi:GAF domain-containing protein